MLRLLRTKPLGHVDVEARCEPFTVNRTLDLGQHLQLDFERKERRFVFGETEALWREFRLGFRGLLGAFNSVFLVFGSTLDIMSVWPFPSPSVASSRWRRSSNGLAAEH
jgi:hypothetical protein